MRPRTMVLVVFGILASSVVLRICIYRFGLLPVTYEAVLKKAVAVQFRYRTANSDSKLLCIGEPQEVRELLSTLYVLDADRLGLRVDTMRQAGIALQGPGLLFTMPDSHWISLRTHPDWNNVAPAFFYKLSEIASRHEGRRIDVNALQTADY